MQFLVYGIIVATLTLDYLGQSGYAPSSLVYIEELLAIATAGVVVVLGVQQKFKNVPPIYWLIFGGFGLVVLCGIFVNQVGSGQIFAGTRTYLRALPYFFLPAVVRFSDDQLKKQLKLILVFAIIQLPIALEQRVRSFDRGYLSGDETVGTIMNSGLLSLFLLSVASVLFAFYLRKRLSLAYTLALMALILPPTMFNETKASIFIVPIAAFVIAVLGANENRARNSLIVVVGTAMFLAAFIPIYDYYMRPKWGYGIVDFFLMEGRVERYLDQNAAVGAHREAGKVDSLTTAIQTLAYGGDPSRLAFGLGIGNVSLSSLGDSFSGVYYQRYQYFIPSLTALLLWEMGVLGALLMVILLWVIFVDAFRVSRGTGFRSDLALGLMGIVAVIGIGTLYKTLVGSGAINYLFWYLCGTIVTERVRAGVVDKELARKVSSADAELSPPMDLRPQH